MDGVLYGATSGSTRSRSRPRARRSRSSSSSSSSDSDAYFPSLGKTAYKRMKTSEEDKMRKRRKGASVLNTGKGQAALLQGINLAERVRGIKAGMEKEKKEGKALDDVDELFQPLSEVTNWDQVKQKAEKAFRDSNSAIKVVTEFQYLLATMDESRETDEALSRIFNVSSAEYATPLGKKVLQQLLKTVEELKPDLKRTIKALKALYLPHETALFKAAKGGKNAGVYLARAQELGEDKTFEGSKRRSRGVF